MKSIIFQFALLASMPSAAFAFGLPGGGGGGFPGLGGGGGGLDAVTEQAKVRTVNSIFAEVGKTAFEGGKLVVAKQKWACDKIGKAEVILSAINKPELASKAADFREKLFCDWTQPIPEEMLAPSKEEIDTQTL